MHSAHRGFKLIPAFVGGLLPLGRFHCELREVQSDLVDAPEFSLWNAFLATTKILEEMRCKLPSAFIGGSFASSKIDPSDIDVTFLIDGSTIRSDSTIARIEQTLLLCRKNFKVQASAIYWFPIPDLYSQKHEFDYLLSRGKFDDWWQRDVAKSERNHFQRHHAFPQRGYLEVKLNGHR
jgi:hypothetical protein